MKHLEFSRRCSTFVSLRGALEAHMSPGPIRSAWELSLARTVVLGTRPPPTSRRDHAGSSASTATAAFFSDRVMTAQEKRAERTRALARRAAAHARHGQAAGDALARHGLNFLTLMPGTVVSGFSAIR